ncbi:MAG: ROK family protein [Paracoccaceae bacterium]
MEDIPDKQGSPYRGPRGASPVRLRKHNERMILTMLRDHGPLSGSEIAKALQLSAQAVSVIIRALDEQNLLLKLPPRKGKVGKPQRPVALNPKGAYSFGLRIGRRSADLALVDLSGTVVARNTIRHSYPTPDRIRAFCGDGLATLQSKLPPEERGRILGLGIAAPHELWNWLDALGAPASEAAKWTGYDFAGAFVDITDLPVTVANDVNLACTGELLFGADPSLQDFIYFYVGSFVGGAIVLNGRVFHGAGGNAGAFGSIPSGSMSDPNAQLIRTASLYALEHQIPGQGNIRADPDLWEEARPQVLCWMEEATASTARAALSVVAALDVTTIMIDGVFPPDIKAEFTAMLARTCGQLDLQGIRPPDVRVGTLGDRAGMLGAAYQPLLEQVFVEGSALA